MHKFTCKPRSNPLKQLPIVAFYLGTLIVATTLIAAPTLYIYNALRPAPPASIRASYSVRPSFERERK